MKEPLKIAQVVGKWVGGGVEAVIMNYYKNIDRSKIQFDFICDSDSTCIPYDEIKALGGKVIIIPPYQKIFRYHKELKKVLKSGNYKIVHSHINTLSVFSLFAAKRAGVPIRIAHSHSTTNNKELLRNLLKIILRPLSKIFATNYMCCSEYSGRWQFGNKLYNQRKVYLMKNAIDVQAFNYKKDIREKIRREINISKDTFVIGHVGRFVETKNHEFLIEVFNEVHKKNKDSVLVLVGSGPLFELIKKKVYDLQLDSNVVFLGQRDDIYNIYQIFDMFVLPSLYEGLGMVLIEAQASGLKCVCSSNVPNEAKITDNLKFLNLEEGHKVWVDYILNSGSYERNQHLEELRENGFNIEVEVKKLEQYYFNCEEIYEKQ